MSSRLGEPRKRSGAARFAGPVAGAPLTPDPKEEEAPQELPSGRLAVEKATDAVPDSRQNGQTMELPVSRQVFNSAEESATSRLAVKTAKPEKRAVAVRLTADALRRLMEIETSLRGSGFSAHQASASEIVMTLLEAADIGDLRERLGRRFGRVRSK